MPSSYNLRIYSLLIELSIDLSLSLSLVRMEIAIGDHQQQSRDFLPYFSLLHHYQSLEFYNRLPNEKKKKKEYRFKGMSETKKSSSDISSFPQMDSEPPLLEMIYLSSNNRKNSSSSSEGYWH